MENSNSSSVIATAIAALRAEEANLNVKLEKLQTRIKSVHSAIESMSQLVDEDVSLSISPSAEVQEKPSAEFEGLSFTKALAKFMSKENKPLSLGEIAKQMKAAGYVFGSKNESAQVYTALNRNKDTLYAKTEDGKKWVTIQSPLV